MFDPFEGAVKYNLENMRKKLDVWSLGFLFWEVLIHWRPSLVYREGKNEI